MNKKIIALLFGTAFLAFAKYIFSTTDGFESVNQSFLSFCASFILVYLFWVVGVFDRMLADFKEGNK
jgi:hypothetical protein